MPDTNARAARQRFTLGTAGRWLLALLPAFLAFNTVFETRLSRGVHQYIEAAELAAASGAFIRPQDSLRHAAGEGALMALPAAGLVMVLGALAGRALTGRGSGDREKVGPAVLRRAAGSDAEDQRG